MAPRTRSRANTDSLESLLDHFTQLKARWLKSTCRAQLLNILEQNKPASGWSIAKAIAFGLGALTGPYRGTAMMQLVFFLDVAENVRAKNEPDIELYLQEPQVSEAPKAKDFLATIGIKVIEDPDGQEMCGPGVFAMTPLAPVEPEILGQCEHRWPDLFFGMDVDSDIELEYRFISDARRALRAPYLPEAIKSAKEQRIVCHRQRVDLLRAYQINHIEVELPKLDLRSPDTHPKMRLNPLGCFRLHFRRKEAAASCGFCANGGRFFYRNLGMDFNDRPGATWGSEEERRYEAQMKDGQRLGRMTQIISGDYEPSPSTVEAWVRMAREGV